MEIADIEYYYFDSPSTYAHLNFTNTFVISPYNQNAKPTRQGNPTESQGNSSQYSLVFISEQTVWK